MAISPPGLLPTVTAFLCLSYAFCSSASPNFATTLSKLSLTSEVTFCSVSNKACSTQLNNLNPFAAVYKTTDESQPATPKLDSSLFFTKSALKPGSKIYLSKSQDIFPQRAPLYVESVKIFCGIGDLQKLVSQSFMNSTTKEAVKSKLLSYCNSSELKGSKVNSCSKLLSEMIKFSKLALGSNHLVALTTKSTKISSKHQLEIGDVKKMKVDKFVSCHGFLLDSAAYLCHAISTIQVYVVEVVDAETKAPINNVLATCHTDTSKWAKEHVAFKILKSSPGKVEACHWSTDLDLVWFGHN